MNRAAGSSITMAIMLLTLADGTSAAGIRRVPRSKVDPASPPPEMVAPRTVGDLVVAFRRDTQTLARLSPVADPAFSFTPLSREGQRASNGFNHLGDLHLRVREKGGQWRDYDSSKTRRPVRPIATRNDEIAAADITETMGADAPFSVERRWLSVDGHLTLRFSITNRTGAPLDLGVVGMPMVFDNILTGLSLDEAHTHGSFAEAYIGRDAGYVQVTRLNGRGPTLLVIPERGTPLEAYAPMTSPEEQGATPFTDLSPRSSTFEGFYDWTVHSLGYRDREWKGADKQWNEPTCGTLAPGATVQFGLRFVQSPDIRSIEATLAANRRPVAVGIPGYVLPMDQTGSLFIKSPTSITDIAVAPAGALLVTRATGRPGWSRLTLHPRAWGRARLTLTYANGERQTVSYFATKPLEQTLADLGRFSFSRQWFDDPADPFHRAPSILNWDREANQPVLSDHRMWIPGLSDEGGAGSFVAAAVKQLYAPNPDEVAGLEQFVDGTLMGKLQIAEGPHVGGVKKSLVWYDRAKFPSQYPGPSDPSWWRWSWNKAEADRLDRTYNYPHVAVVHWVLYRLARNHPGLVTHHDARWYLDQAFTTVMAMRREASLYAEYGLMEGDVFVDILDDLRREGMNTSADAMESYMRSRADHWRSLKYPFGSEMPWDSTGQPEVYAWMRRFGYEAQANTTRDVILGYDATIPSWGFNGNARRYWDFGTAGKYERVERQIHHYGSGINAMPLLEAYRHDPKDLYLLRVGYGGMMGAVTGIDRDGAASTAFHSWPDMMRWDPYSTDFGVGFYGHVRASATYVVDDPTFGWLGFGGDVSERSNVIDVIPRDGAQAQLFLAPTGQWIVLDAGRISKASYYRSQRRLTLTLAPKDRFTATARLRISSTITGGKPMTLVEPKRPASRTGEYAIPLGSTPTSVTFRGD